VNQAVPPRNGPNVTIIAALTPQGLEAVMELDGAANAASFAVYLEQVLGPTLVPGDVVVPDNLRVHKAAGLAELVEKRGARLLFLPPYSPDFTPVELAFSQLNRGAHGPGPHPGGPDGGRAGRLGLDKRRRRHTLV